MYVLLVLCWGIVLARVIWPKLNFDTISLILFAIGAAAALLPTVLTVLPPITRLKLFEVEAEFGRHINELERTVVAAETSPASAESVPRRDADESAAGGVTHSVSWQAYFDEYFRIITSTVSPREKILSVAILLERMLEDAAARYSPKTARSSRDLVELLTTHHLLTPEEAAAINEFWEVRNRVVHGQPSVFTEADAARILDLAWRLVRIFA